MPSVDAPEPPRPWMRRGAAARGLRSVLFGALAGVFIALAMQREFLKSMIYSTCISAACWFFIDGGRSLAVRWQLHRARRTGAVPPAETGWPGYAAMVGVVVVGTLLGASLGTAVGNAITGQVFPKFDVYTSRGLLSFIALSLLPAAVITYVFYSREVITAQRQKVESAERQAAETRLKLLESQLEPHMLFNTLANLRVLIGIDPPRAQAMLDSLIAFLRSTLAASRVGEQSLAAEFTRLEDYLALIQIRMGDRLQTSFDLPDGLAAAPVPPLLLQPLVENAVKHGLEPHIAGGRIDVGAARDGDDLVLTVRDTGAGLGAMPADASGFGVAQVRERLATLYGATASLELRAASDGAGGTCATVRLPWRGATTLPAN